MLLIDLGKCNGCGLCVEVCYCQNLMLVGRKVEKKEHRECPGCSKWCTMCEMVCTTGAIQCSFEVVTEG